MEYICRHCGANLDDGDVFEYFLLEYNDHIKAIESARLYGWSETNKVHFERTIIIQPLYGSHYEICPDCKEKYPYHENKQKK